MRLAEWPEDLKSELSIRHQRLVLRMEPCDLFVVFTVAQLVTSGRGWFGPARSQAAPCALGKLCFSERRAHRRLLDLLIRSAA